MNLTYVLLSPIFGMHQYTADYTNRLPADATLVTTTTYPAAPYLPQVRVRTPVTTHDTGLNRAAMGRAVRLMRKLPVEELSGGTFAGADVVHFTGPHLWNVPLLIRLRRAGIPTVHTLHDLDPHPGTGYGPLLYVWNRLVAQCATHILVHGRRYRRRVARWIGAARVTYVPLLHGFWGGEWSMAGDWCPAPSHQPPATRFALFFGRMEAYKGLETLLQSCVQLSGEHPRLCGGGGVLEWERDEPPRVVLAGKGALSEVWDGALPAGVEVRNRHIDDAEAVDLFRRCAALVLPYRQATQSALIAAAYVFHKPVIVTDTGALAEYVVPGETGWVVPPRDPGALAQALAEALAEPEECRRRGENGRAWYEAQRREEWATLLDMYARVAGKGWDTD